MIELPSLHSGSPSSEPETAAFSHYPANPPPTAVRLAVLPAHPCSYLPGETAQMRGVLASRLSPSMYHAFMDAGFRRSGRLIYQPICRACRRCRSLRVPVAGFHPNKSQRRCSRQNADLKISVGPPRADDEAFALYSRYAAEWHQQVDDDPRHDQQQAFESFLYDSPVDTIEFRYRDHDEVLLAVGICDVSNEAISSVYFYFDPRAASRSLGTFGALCEIDFAAKRGVSYYYLGYWIEACRAMTYKTRFQPFELLNDDGEWRGNSSTEGFTAAKTLEVD